MQAWDIDLFYDLAENLFGKPGRSRPPTAGRATSTPSTKCPTRAGSPIASSRGRCRSRKRARGPLDRHRAGARPLVDHPAQGGRVRAGLHDARRRRATLWFVSFDAKGFPEAATGAILVANKIFWTLGYWQVENHPDLACGRDQLVIGRTATVTSAVRQATGRCGSSDLEDVLRRVAPQPRRHLPRRRRARGARARRSADSATTARGPTIPNDIVPHEHRRELRALKVFGAWTNLVDMKAGNTLDTLITENGRSVVRHYLQDVGSTFGTGANAPHDYDEGWEHLFEGDLDVETPGHPRLLICSPGRPRHTRTIPRSAGSRATCSIRRAGSRACRPPRFLRARADDTSGRRGASWRSPTR